MSSILDALKKAERESNGERGRNVPGAALLPKRSPYAPTKRRWWLPLGLIGGACIAAVLFWQFRGPKPVPPGSASVPPPSFQTRTRSTPPTAPSEEATMPAASQEQTAAFKPAADQKPLKRTEVHMQTSMPQQAPEPVAARAQPVAPPAEQQASRHPQAAVPEATPPAVETSTHQAAADPDDSVDAAPEEAQQPPQKSVATPLAASPSAQESRKTFRSDPRIELQALVWAPEASARFVVINDRLLKEGGSTDGITVVQINRDDVLLSEGADRWHEKFKIR